MYEYYPFETQEPSDGSGFLYRKEESKNTTLVCDRQNLKYSIIWTYVATRSSKQRFILQNED